jgi:hypothetical protein
MDWYVARERFENPPDGDQQFAAIAPWGDTPEEVEQVVGEIAGSLGVGMHLVVVFIDAFAEEGSSALARCQPLRQLIEIASAQWQGSRPWRRLEHAAHETFHAYQYEVSERARTGSRIDLDPPEDKVNSWQRTDNDFWNGVLAAQFRKEPRNPSVKLGFLRMFKRYATHPYEDDATAFARDYLRSKLEQGSQPDG